MFIPAVWPTVQLQRKDWRHSLETIPWSNAGGGRTQEAYGLYVFSEEENALRHKHLLHVHECPSPWHKATSLKCSLSLGGTSTSHRPKLLLALWTPAMIKHRDVLLHWNETTAEDAEKHRLRLSQNPCSRIWFLWNVLHHLSYFFPVLCR